MLRKRGNKYYNSLDQEVDTEFTRRLRIPPAYKNVTVYLNHPKWLARGYDDKDRMQVIYKETAVKKRDKEKYCRIVQFAKSLPKIERDINKNLRSKNYIEHDIALILTIMMKCHFRIGNDIHRRRYNSFGISTIEQKHVKHLENYTKIKFRGKKGVENCCIIRNKEIIKHLKEHRKTSIFNVTGKQVNNYLSKYSITTKDFRTWYANLYFIEEVQKIKLEDKEINRKRQIKGIINIVAKRLQHTAAICKKSYIDNELINNVIKGNQFKGSAREVLKEYGRRHCRR